jgi:ABC-type multidrug transport system fused ATPase/permease subunit
MKLLKKFKELSLAKQLQLLFTISSSILIAFLILISYYLIYWLKEKLIEETDDLVDSIQEEEMIRLMQLNAKSITTEFSYFLALPTYLARLSSDICEERFPLVKGKGTFNYTEAISLDISLFSSKSEVSITGKELVSNESSLDAILPSLKSENFLQLYQGFEIDDLIHIYPPITMPVGYTPSIREWYYTAKRTIGEPVFTEPYADAFSGEWIISTSHAITCYSQFLGVSAADITLKSIRNRLSTSSLPRNGFFLLVSASGIIVTMPKSWTGETARLNDTELTGFPQSLWMKAIDETTNIHHRYRFQDQSGSSVFCFRNLIKPSVINKTTHFLFVCGYENIQDVFSQSTEKVFEKTNTVIFWMVLGISVGVFFGTVVIIFWISRKISVEVDFLVKTVQAICAKSVFPDCAGLVKVDQRDQEKNFFGLIPKGIEKVRGLQNREKEFYSYTWGVTRPNDRFLYNSWEAKKYPRNYSSCVQIKWRDLFAELIRRTFHSGHYDL